MNSVLLQNIAKDFNKKSVLSDINLQIKSGEFILLKGESGSGKTTLLNIIGGIEKPTRGNIEISGQNISSLKPKQRVDFYRRKISFVFQGFYLHPNLNLRDNIALAGIFAKISKNKRNDRVLKLAQLLRIADILDSRPNQISGGQAERACVARALFMNPDIILVDEPTNNLDDKNAEDIIAILQLLSKKLGTTIIVSSHDKRFETRVDRVLTLQNGVLYENN